LCQASVLYISDSFGDAGAFSAFSALLAVVQSGFRVTEFDESKDNSMQTSARCCQTLSKNHFSFSFYESFCNLCRFFFSQAPIFLLTEAASV